MSPRQKYSPHKLRVIASPVLLYLMAHVSASISEIARWGEMSRETVSGYLRNLPPELVTRTKGKRWMLTDGGMRSLLGERAYLVDAVQAKLADNPRQLADYPRVCDLPTTACIKDLINLKAVVVGENLADSPRDFADYPRVETQISPDVDNSAKSVENPVDNSLQEGVSVDKVGENLETLRAFGVGRNKAVLEICGRPNVTPDAIRAHAERLRAERRLTPGMLITVLRDDDPIVAQNKRDHANNDAYQDWEDE